MSSSLTNKRYPSTLPPPAVSSDCCFVAFLPESCSQSRRPIELPRGRAGRFPLALKKSIPVQLPSFSFLPHPSPTAEELSQERPGGRFRTKRCPELAVTEQRPVDEHVGSDQSRSLSRVFDNGALLNQPEEILPLTLAIEERNLPRLPPLTTLRRHCFCPPAKVASKPRKQLASSHMVEPVEPVNPQSPGPTSAVVYCSIHFPFLHLLHSSQSE